MTKAGDGAETTKALQTERDQVGHAAESIARALEDEIVFGKRVPGDALREEKLLAQFKVSRHVIRGALAILEAKGIVVRERNRGAVVRILTAQEVIEIHDVREILQRQAALRIRLPVPQKDLLQIEEIEREYETAVESGDLHGMHEANNRFHDAIFGLCGNRKLQDLIRYLYEMTFTIRTRSLADRQDRSQAQAEHRLLIKLLKGTDNWALAELCIEHTRPRRDTYLEFLAAGKKRQRRKATTQA